MHLEESCTYVLVPSVEKNGERGSKQCTPFDVSMYVSLLLNGGRGSFVTIFYCKYCKLAKLSLSSLMFSTEII